MTAKAQEALDIALQLDRHERARLVAQLIETLDEDGETPADWDEAWADELDSRLADGDSSWVPGPEAVQQIFRRS